MAHFLLRQMSPFPILPQKKVILKTFRWKEKKEKPKGKKKKKSKFLNHGSFPQTAGEMA